MHAIHSISLYTGTHPKTYFIKITHLVIFAFILIIIIKKKTMKIESKQKKKKQKRKFN